MRAPGIDAYILSIREYICIYTEYIRYIYQARREEIMKKKMMTKEEDDDDERNANGRNKVCSRGGLRNGYN